MAIIEVFPGSPTAIQDTITSANEGDVILVHAGVYFEAVEVPSDKNNIRIVSKIKHRAILQGSHTLLDAFTLRDVAGAQIEGFTIKNYVATGIRILNGKSHRILHNQISNIGGIVSPVGIWVINSVGNLLLNNSVKRVVNSDFGAGIQLAGGSGNWIVQNKVQHNDIHGIAVVDSKHGAIVGNQISDNKREGILITGSDNHLILNNKLFHNGNNGVHAQSTNNLIVDSTIKGNHENGLLFGSNYNFAGCNEIKDNEQSGIQISADFNDIQGNIIKRNNNNGIWIQPTQTANFVYENQLEQNQPHNIKDLGVNNNILQNRTKETP